MCLVVYMYASTDPYSDRYWVGYTAPTEPDDVIGLINEDSWDNYRGKCYTSCRSVR